MVRNMTSVKGELAATHIMNSERREQPRADRERPLEKATASTGSEHIKRVFVVILDSVGVGQLPDAHLYGDEGSDTLGNIAWFLERSGAGCPDSGGHAPELDEVQAGENTAQAGVDAANPENAVVGARVFLTPMNTAASLNGSSDSGGCVRGLSLPNLGALGIGNLTSIIGTPPAVPLGVCCKMAERSPGKDTTTGHWELAGVVLSEPFKTYPDGFPPDRITEFERRIGRSLLGNKPASGTEIIQELGPEHVATGRPIVYTSADSVFQIACHEEVVPLETLYEWCRIARELFPEPTSLARVIARPFVGPVGGRRAGDSSLPGTSDAPESMVPDSDNSGERAGTVADSPSSVAHSGDAVLSIGVAADSEPTEGHPTDGTPSAGDASLAGVAVSAGSAGSLARYIRTANRKDFSVPPPRPTLLEYAQESGVTVTGIGKIEDIFAGRGIDRSIHTKSNNEGVEAVLREMRRQVPPSGTAGNSSVESMGLSGSSDLVGGQSSSPGPPLSTDPTDQPNLPPSTHLTVSQGPYLSADSTSRSSSLDPLGEPALGSATLGRHLVMANLVDFDSLYGHRNDPVGYARTLVEFDRELPSLIGSLGADDVLIITADHGCDPTTPSTDHSREYVPVLMVGAPLKSGLVLAERPSFADLGATVADLLGIDYGGDGTSFAEEIVLKK